MNKSLNIVNNYLSQFDWEEEDKRKFITLFNESLTVIENNAEVRKGVNQYITIASQIISGVSRKVHNLDLSKLITLLNDKGDRFVELFGSSQEIICSIYELAGSLSEASLEQLNELEACIVTLLWSNRKSHSVSTFYEAMNDYLSSVNKTPCTQQDLFSSLTRLISIKSVIKSRGLYILIEEVKFS
ncbi:putative uncharacterized protein [Aliivibrio wodanis]|uniref:Uncharacterized protein n=1 Tax=Aliivibrio wodanis TaxID=80852 RepID=A0A090I6P9_9GAMM|nr:putative uncharacterized protein [Aliivibrio wodanis]